MSVWFHSRPSSSTVMTTPLPVMPFFQTGITCRSSLGRDDDVRVSCWKGRMRKDSLSECVSNPGSYSWVPLNTLRYSQPLYEDKSHFCMTQPLTLPTKAVCLKMKAGDVIAHADLLVCGDYFQSRLELERISSYWPIIKYQKAAVQWWEYTVEWQVYKTQLTRVVWNVLAEGFPSN